MAYANDPMAPVPLTNQAGDGFNPMTPTPLRPASVTPRPAAATGGLLGQVRQAQAAQRSALPGGTSLLDKARAARERQRTTGTVLPAPATASPSASPAAPMTMPGGTVLTSTAGDGFGSSPAGSSGMTPAGAAGGAPVVDRFALARDRWNQYVTGEAEPAYQAALRQANRLGAAAGQLGAGELRTDFGNLTQAYGRDLNTQARGFLSDALEGTIGDNQRAFENELATLGLQDDLLNSAFGRALQQYGAGTRIDPSGTGLAVGAAQGAQAARAGGSWLDLLRQLGAGSAASGAAGAAAPAPAPTTGWQPDWNWRQTLPGGG